MEWDKDCMEVSISVEQVSLIMPKACIVYGQIS